MLSKSIRTMLAAGLVAICSTLGFAGKADAQLIPNQEPSGPQSITIGVGGGVNSNFAFGDYDPTDGGGMSYAAGDYHRPAFHAEMEIPVSSTFRTAIRASYNDLSSVLDDDSHGRTITASETRAYSLKTVGVDALAKYTIDGGLHVMGGGNVSAAVERRVAMGDNTKAAHDSQQNLSAPDVMFSAIAGVGYDIPVGSDRIWLTPEVTFNVPLKDFAQGTADGSLRANTLASKVTLKFALDQ